MGAIAIIIMHALANVGYLAAGSVEQIISHFGYFTRLFFIISGFGMCCVGTTKRQRIVI